MKNNNKRARTNFQKTDRRSDILLAARQCITESGFDGVTMNRLAQSAGLAKGTLYLYFETKEELFALLMAEELERFTEAILSKLDDDNALIDAMVFQANDNALFLPILARLTTIIEKNLSCDALVSFKRIALGQVTMISEGFVRSRNINSADATELTLALFSALQGAAQYCIMPSIDLESLPDDVRQLYESGTFEATFRRAARFILIGATSSLTPLKSFDAC